MRVLFVSKQKKNVDTFETTIAELLARGHEVVLAIQQRDEERDRKLAERLSSPRFSLVSCPEERSDGWRRTAPLIRSTRDWAHYFQPAYARAGKLRQRALNRLLRELGSTAVLDAEAFLLDAAAGARVRSTLAGVEAAIPSDPLHEEFLRRHRPDVLLVSPGLHFGSGQSDFIKSAQALGIPAWMLLFSWDNLSTKGALHVAPDHLFVWNARQVREAEELHGFPSSQVTIVGAPRFDEFFALRSRVSREAFFAPLGLDAQRPTLLYLCSSRFIAADEAAFIDTWLTALRHSASEHLRACNVIVRPHPDVPFEPANGQPDAIAWKGLPQATGWLHRPFADERAVVLRTTYSTPQAFYECLHHADVVVALNTSAELEAGIAGRPVLTVLATGDAADGQAHTLHFDYLLRDHGGFVDYSPDLETHLQRLDDTLGRGPQTETIRAFIMSFLRPLGDRPVAPLLAEAICSKALPVTGDPRPPVISHSTAEATPLLAEPVPTTALSNKTLQLDGIDGGTGISVLATPETKRIRQRGTLRLDPVVRQWLLDAVAPGDTIYDIGAGIGTCALVAALSRGALAIAFEPGFAVYRALCENIRLNDAAHSVIALPIALTDRAGFFELEFSGAPGGDHHVLRNREWRARREMDPNRQGQAVCADRLDEVLARYQLPLPTAVRINARRGAEHIVAGATQLLRSETLKSLLLTVGREEDATAAAAALRGAGYAAGERHHDEEFGVSIRFERQADGTTGMWDRLRAAATKPRRGHS